MVRVIGVCKRMGEDIGCVARFRDNAQRQIVYGGIVGHRVVGVILLLSR